MAMAPSRFSSRHLLAVCTFLVPLGLLAWFGAAELGRQGQRAREAIEAQALTFLRSADAVLEQHLQGRLPAILLASEAALADAGLPAATRWLREGDTAHEVVDLLLLDERGGVVAPQPAPIDPGLPLFRSTRPRQSQHADTLHAAEALLGRGELTAAATLLQQLLDGLRQAPRRPALGNEPLETELRARFLLATLHRRQQQPDAAREQFERLRQLLASPRLPALADANLTGLDLLAECALAELAGPPAVLELMEHIVAGRRDQQPDALLAAVLDRLFGHIPAESPERPAAIAAMRTEEFRRHGRAFASDYELLLLETVRRRLRQTEEGGTLLVASGATSRPSLLLARAATAAERTRHGCAFVALRLDLGDLLGEPLAAFLAADHQGFVLAVEDADGLPLLGGTDGSATEAESALIQSHGLRLRAVPADAAAMLAGAAASARNRALLLGALFLVAVVGAAWLWRSVSRATELAALKVDFVSRVSHELKTPLALIRMYGETLGMGRARDEGQARRFGSIVAREAERLGAMIQRILDFSRQQTGTLTYEPETVDLATCLGQVAEAYGPHLEARGARLRLDLQPGLRAEVDPTALEGAVINLLENAAKYGATDGTDGADDPGATTIELHLARTGPEAAAGAGTARIEVRDRGRGVPPAERERIFDSFYRASNAAEVRGAGLGLSLVRHFAEAHGGRVGVLPRPDGGSIFHLQLPLLSEPT